MPYEELIPIALGGSQTGLTLRAVLREPDSGTVVNFADAATFKNTGFVERGNGEYTFHSDQFPDAFQGVVEIQLDGDSSYQASATVSPPVSLDADDILDAADAIETGWTLRQAIRVIGALAAKLSGAGTTTEVFRNLADTKDRITATVDASGNRTAITYDKD